ncbi:GRAM domain-containing protein [Dioscorea alata]|uniref:GRAM domain-containing protein n=1 Tax=Dioscorea alata TaxID=55571 RepID=A0ACB7UG98_DIOAL|nr:GRAM domain-containing protein [Dioscorea alata]
MALAAAPLDQSFRASPSRVVSRQDAEASSETSSVYSADPSDRRDAEILAMSTRSEEYRLLFRLPPDEVLVQDFNCALQENILLQGHMYLFLHHICFYSNIFGFETKKTISFLEVSCVRKAKTAGIFPNAIEILAGGKKHFFGSFLSRDEAYKLIMEGWLQHNNDAKAIFDQQDMKSDVNGSNNSLAIVEIARGSTPPPSDSLTSDGNMNANILDECLPSSGEDGIIVPSRLVEVKENGEEKAEHLSTGNLSWPVEDVDAPKVPEYFTLVAEAKFSVCVEDFFTLFFSNNAAEFLENFRKGCGDKEFQHTLWHQNEQFRYTRDITFLHPVKIYLGAKYGRCQEVQKFRVYRNSHLVIETSQQISDVPYGDYFKGIWDVQQLSGETGCILRVYINVAFSKKTMFRGKIEQSTKDECREVYALWINNANDLLKQKKDVKLEDTISTNVGSGSSSEPAGDLMHNGIFEEIIETVSDKIPPQSESPMTVNLENWRSALVIFREAWASLSSYCGSQSYLPFVIAAAFLAVLILMQVSIILILTRVPEVHIVTEGNYISGPGSYSLENVEWLERRFNYLKEEMLMLESRMERMRHEYTLLKASLQSIEKLKPKP